MNPSWILHTRDFPTSDGLLSLTLVEEDFTDLYPRFLRYTLSLRKGGELVALFRTNTYEYTPTDPLEARSVAQARAAEWEGALASAPARFFAPHPVPVYEMPPAPASDVVVLQGSPRADGNCGILASWAADAARAKGATVQVIYPHDRYIRPCIGCYQCYNTGTCIYRDEMDDIIPALEHARLLVICSPVYTNTVPGGLKLLVDRCQAYHAWRVLTASPARKKGLLFVVAGRKGLENFTCVQHTLRAFLNNLSIPLAGEVLVDQMDERRDIRKVTGIAVQVRELVQRHL